MLCSNIWVLATIFAMNFLLRTVATYPEQCINEFCFTTPGSAVRRDFDGAKSWCAEDSSRLAVVNDSNSQQMLTQFLSYSHLKEPAFINVRIYDQWVESTWFLVNGSKYFGGVLNQDYKEAQYAVYSYLNYSSVGFVLTAANPNQLRSYVCEIQDTRMCPDNPSNFIFNGSCYIKKDGDARTWFQSREICRNMGGDLATFNYVNDTYFGNYVAPLNTSWLDASLTYWVGIRWQKWLWKSPECGDEIFYTFWSPGAPNNTAFKCVCADPNGNPSFSWIDCDCNNPRQFVCVKSATATAAPTRLTDAMLIGLAVGVAMNLPLLIIILILVVIVVRQRGRLREKRRPGESSCRPENSPQETSTNELETYADGSRYAHLPNGQGTTSKRLYDKIKRPQLF